jgi:hypothetical protein
MSDYPLSLQRLEHPPRAAISRSLDRVGPRARRINLAECGGDVVLAEAEVGRFLAHGRGR